MRSLWFSKSAQMDKFERKAVVDRFNQLVIKLDAISECDSGDDPEANKIRDELDQIWYKEMDDIAEVQVDPLRTGNNSNSIKVVDRKVVDEGELARFTGQIHDEELDIWDSLDATRPWKDLDICFTSFYAVVAAFLGISRLQDMKVLDEYWTPRIVMES